MVIVYLIENNRLSLVTASIMSASASTSLHHGSSAVVSVASGQGLNGVKLEGQYYCNSYTPPTPVDHGLLPPSYSEFTNILRSLLRSHSIVEISIGLLVGQILSIVVLALQMFSNVTIKSQNWGSGLS